MEIQNLLDHVVSHNASDLHLLVGLPPMIRIDGNLSDVTNTTPLSDDDLDRYVTAILPQEQKELLLVNKEIDFSFTFGDHARFRVNAYYERGHMAVAFRFLPMVIRTVEELHIPKIAHTFAGLKQGFILVTGPTGHGKSTTIAAILNEINMERAVHILTIEDPIEYVFPKARAVVSQREMHFDTHSWDLAMRSALREDPAVVFIGEMRAYETISAALTIAETGHLVLATLHTNNAAQTMDRIVDVFPEQAKGQARLQLSNTIEGVISQRLLPQIEGGRVVATEILTATPAVRNVIREGKSRLVAVHGAAVGKGGRVSAEGRPGDRSGGAAGKQDRAAVDGRSVVAKGVLGKRERPRAREVDRAAAARARRVRRRAGASARRRAASSCRSRSGRARR